METVTLYRPTGTKELALIRASGFSGFPARLPGQPIFYPVTNRDYAAQIARDWNTRFGDRIGFVTRFEVKADYLAKFEKRIVGSAVHEEYWIPAEDLDEFNSNIVGEIEVIDTFHAQDSGQVEDEERRNA